jgi:Recombinase
MADTRYPTGRPRGRPVGSGGLGPQTRLTVRLPTVLFDRLEAYAEGRSAARGTPRLDRARWVREAILHYLACPHKQQTGNAPQPTEDTNRQTKNFPGRPAVPVPEGGAGVDAQMEDTLRRLLDPSSEQSKRLEQLLEEGKWLLERPDIVAQGQRLEALLAQSAPLGVPEASPPAEPSTEGNTVLQDKGKAAVVARLRQMRASGLSLQKIAAQLQAEGLRTLSGRGQWTKGSVDKLLRASTG